jgi:cytidine deaminase
MEKPSDSDIAKLLNAAESALSHAYCPYSRFPVAAAVRTTDGLIFTGVNVENACAALGLCAERAAVCAMIAGAGILADAGARAIAAVAMVAPHANPCYPCGACLQFIAEFAASECVIVVKDEDGKPSVVSLNELLPHPFKLDAKM